MTTPHSTFFRKFKTTPQGLSQSEAQERLLSYGLNKLKAQVKDPLWLKFLRQFTDLMVIILILAAIVSIIVALIQGHPEEMTDAYIILGIVFLNAVIGFIQEYKTEKALEALQKMIAPQARIIRDGKEFLIEAEKLVPGDILILAEGDKISADAELFESNEFKVEESALTGESLPVLKNSNFKDTDKQDVHHNPKLIFMGTSVVHGSGKAVVTHTGMQTEFGKIAKMTVTTVKDKSPLQKELTNIGLFVGKITLIISAILFSIGIIFQGYSFIEALLFAVAVAVAAVPEGLPATITIALALGVQRLARKNAIVKQLSSIETLGSTTVICSDKTGTLTKNEMTVTQALLGIKNKIIFQGTGYTPTGKIELTKETNQQDFEKLLKIASICNEAKHIQDKNGKWSILGDPTEGALLVAARKAKINFTEGVKIKKTFPFDSERKCMSVVLKNEIYVKGAPDNIIEKCTQILLNGKIQKLTTNLKNKILEQNKNLANQALRVLAVAYKKRNGEIMTITESEKDLIYVGLISMIDPPRPEVPPAVKLCHQAGIRTIIITGDFGLTAKAIAKKIKIANQNTPIITGSELEKMNQATLKKHLKQKGSLIFARVAPSHKKRVVDTLKELGEIVAVTGDGVNDAPALKRADIGIAMGITGTDVSKESANMILTDDSFASIITAVAEGRRIYDNLKNFVWYIFSCNIGELTTIFIAIILRIPAPLTAILILAVDLGTDVLPSLALGIDYSHPNIMQIPPRNPQKHIMHKKFIIHFVTLGIFTGMTVISLYLYDLMRAGWQWGIALSKTDSLHLHASTMLFAALITIQLVNTFNARSREISVFKLRTNPYIWGSVLISGIMMLILIQIPFFQIIFHTVSLSITDWLLVLGTSFSILVVEEIRKYFKKPSRSTSTTYSPTS